MIELLQSREFKNNLDSINNGITAAFEGLNKYFKKS